MSSVLVPEVQLAQKLACNEKPVRTKALKRLRKYVSVRSQTKDGFSGDDLLRLWKGLFYCLWMQDKPLLQEELSNQITTLIHSFYNIDQQFLFLETFLQTISREWTGIDRLRLDKFYQLVRFMFRQTFEVLKRKNWNTRAVNQFLDLLTREVLQNTSDASSELQLHILDLYLNELAAVSSAELTADQNLVFIDPFCKTAAKTKNRTLFSAVYTNIFTTIIDQAPFAIEDLMKEVKAAGEEEEDSGQESEEEDFRGTEKMKSTAVSGSKGAEEEENDELHQSEGSDAELHDMGPFLQFDYGAVADRLFELASRNGTPAQNRQRLYGIIKVLRNLSEGIFPQNEYPEDVSTDEDDDMFGSRKRMKRSHGDMEDRGEAAEEKKKKRKKKRKEEATNTGTAEVLDIKDQNVDSVNGLDQNQSERNTEPLRSDSEPEKQETEEQQMSSGGDVPASERKKMKKKRRLAQAEAKVPPVNSPENGHAAASAENTHLTGESSAGPAGSPTEVQTEEDFPNSTKNFSTPSTQDSPADSAKTKRKRKRKSRALQADEEQNDATDSALQTSTPVPVKKMTKKMMTKKNQVPEQASVAGDDSEVNNQEEPGTTTGESVIIKKTPTKKRKKLTGGQMNEVPVQVMEVSGGSQAIEAGHVSSETEAVKKKKKIPVEFEFESDELKAMLSDFVPEETRGGKKKKKIPFQHVSQPSTPSGLKKSQKKNPAAGSGCDFISFQNKVVVPSPLFCRPKGRSGLPQSTRKKNQSLSDSKKVTFGLKNNKTAEFRKTDRSLLLSPEGSSRVPFDPQQKPKCGVLKSPLLTTPTNRKKNPVCSRSPASKLLKRRPMAADFF